MTDEYCDVSGIKLDKKTEELKPFNLERALAGDPIILTGSGYEIKGRLVFLSEINTTYKYLVVFKENNVEIETSCWVEEHKIFMAPIKKTYYVNVLKSYDGSIFLGRIHSSLEEIKMYDPTDIIKTLEFEVEE